MSVRQLCSSELSGVYDIDMTESDDVVYQVVAGRLEPVAETWARRPRARETWDAMIAEWRTTLEVGGAAWGAFDGARMVGVAVLRDHIRCDLAQLEALFVSRTYRRLGVAHRLVEALLARARQGRAVRIYVSATPSRSAVGFYRSQGFRLADVVVPELYAREPEDVHMVRELEVVAKPRS